MMQQSSSTQPRNAPTRPLGWIAGLLAVASVILLYRMLILLAAALHNIVTQMQQKSRVLPESQDENTGNTNVRMLRVLVEVDEHEIEARKWLRIINQMSIHHKLNTHIPAGVRGMFYGVSRQ